MKHSAGLLMYRRNANTLEVFLVHPGGPIWAAKDKQAWSMPKGMCEPSEAPFDAAQREFYEETGFAPHGPYFSLGSILQPSKKLLTAYAFHGDCDPSALVSNTCTIQWPPKSGRTLEIPEIDRGNWFSLAAARSSIRPGQVPFLDLLLDHLHA